jgi:hypothetical protein
VDVTTSLTVTLNWTAPGDDGDTGTASTYELRRSGETITAANWDDATIVPGLGDPAEAGSSESFTVTGLNLDTEYHFAILSSDEAANISDISEEVMVTTLARPVVVSVDPLDVSTNISLLTIFTIEFDRPMDPATLIPANVDLLVREFDKDIEYSLDYQTMFVIPRPNLAPGISINLQLGAGILDQDGLAIEARTLSYTTGPNDCEHWADRFEPNEDAYEASILELDLVYPHVSTCGDDVDLYGFTLTEPRKVTVSTAIIQAIPDPEDNDEFPNWAIFWVRENGDAYTTKGTSAHPGESRSFHYSFFPGTYYAKIWCGDDEVLVHYEVEFSTSEPCADDEYEDNDFRDEAKPISPGLHENLSGCYLDKDWYSIPVISGQTFTMTVNTGDYTGTRRVRAYEPGGGQFYTTNSNNPISDSIEITADGTLDLAFEVWADDVIYDMELTLTD